MNSARICAGEENPCGTHVRATSRRRGARVLCSVGFYEKARCEIENRLIRALFLLEPFSSNLA